MLIGLISFIVGLIVGYAVREFLSRRRRASARKRFYEIRAYPPSHDRQTAHTLFNKIVAQSDEARAWQPKAESKTEVT
jgi:hypothetical protein